MFDATIFAVKEHSGNRKSDGSPFHFFDMLLSGDLFRFGWQAFRSVFRRVLGLSSCLE